MLRYGLAVAIYLFLLFLLRFDQHNRAAIPLEQRRPGRARGCVAFHAKAGADEKKPRPKHRDSGSAANGAQAKAVDFAEFGHPALLWTSRIERGVHR
ncbi:hypothetical protein CHELA1G11_13977 [Hyphomicrobiales bacterium]|nr:hypothetical protein CHELA1G11_13977 [Hyphomicrobiales bacterium]